MRKTSTIKNAALVAVMSGVWGSAALAGDLSFQLRIGGAPPPPRNEPVVVTYETYCVGYRANLYDADWRLRVACTSSGVPRTIWARRASTRARSR